MVADMEVDMVADMKVDMVADMGVDKVADKVADMVAEIFLKNFNVYTSCRIGRQGRQMRWG